MLTGVWGRSLEISLNLKSPDDGAGLWAPARAAEQRSEARASLGDSILGRDLRI